MSSVVLASGVISKELKNSPRLNHKRYNLSLLPEFDDQFKNKLVDIKELAQLFKQQYYLKAFEDKYKQQPVLLNL